MKLRYDLFGWFFLIMAFYILYGLERKRKWGGENFLGSRPVIIYCSHSSPFLVFSPVLYSFKGLNSLLSSIALIFFCGK